jgi:3-oxoacyl-[acyl-carrier-protein] synthase II
MLENFALENYLDSKKTYLDRCSALALAGGALALRDANVSWPLNDERFGITLGTRFGCLETMKAFWDNVLEKGARLANPILFSHSYINSPISLCAIEFGLKGYHSTFCAGEYSGFEAVRAAYDAIQLGHADAMLCGGVEALTPSRKLFASEASRGEAATFFVMEVAERATQRGATSTLPLGEEWFADIRERVEKARVLFGDCGGALGALALLASPTDI